MCKILKKQMTDPSNDLTLYDGDEYMSFYDYTLIHEFENPYVPENGGSEESTESEDFETEEELSDEPFPDDEGSSVSGNTADDTYHEEEEYLIDNNGDTA